MSFQPKIGNDWVLPVRFWCDYSERPEPTLIIKENWNLEADVRYCVLYDLW